MTKFDYTASFFQGGYWSNQIAERLNDMGVACYAPPVQIARTQAEREHMTKNEKDIVFSWTDRPLEVKSSSRVFTDRIIDYPYDSLFVDTVSGYDSKLLPPLAYVIVSQATTDAVVISPHSHGEWSKVERYDRYRKIHEHFYSAPKHCLVPFTVLVDYLKLLASATV